MVVPLIGYLDRFSARPGERIAVKVSSQRHEPYDADLVRIIHGDANPAGPGLKINEIEPGFAGRYPSRFQPVHSGSCGVVTMPASIALPDRCTIVVRVQPWLLDGRPQTVLSLEPPGITLSVSAEGAVLEAQGRRVQVSAPMLQRRWYELRIIASAGALRLRQTALQRSWGVADSGEAEMPGSIGAVPGVVFGARPTVGARSHDNPYSAFFNGRIEDPAVLEGALLSEAPIDPSQVKCLAWWDFGAEIPTDRIIDRGPHGFHGRLRHLPTRAVRGSYWTGDETSWRHMPRHYAAIHFHDDDLYDCEWETDFEIEIPEGMPSGVYGVRRRWGAVAAFVPVYCLHAW